MPSIRKIHRSGPGRGATRGSVRRETEAVPTNALTGQQFVVNSGTADITVPYQYSKAEALAQYRSSRG